MKIRDEVVVSDLYDDESDVQQDFLKTERDSVKIKIPYASKYIVYIITLSFLFYLAYLSLTTILDFLSNLPPMAIVAVIFIFLFISTMFGSD